MIKQKYYLVRLEIIWWWYVPRAEHHTQSHRTVIFVFDQRQP